MFDPFINLINNVIYLINLGLMVYIVLQLLVQFDILNRGNPLVRRVLAALAAFFEPMLRPIRRALGKLFPTLGGIDISPIILILLLHFLSDALVSWG